MEKWQQKFENYQIVSNVSKKREEIQCVQLQHLIGDKVIKQLMGHLARLNFENIKITNVTYC